MLLSRIGYVQLALGHVGAAEATFARAAAIAATPAYGTDKEVQAAVRRNQGLLLTANQDYKGGCSVRRCLYELNAMGSSQKTKKLLTGFQYVRGAAPRSILWCRNNMLQHHRRCGFHGSYDNNSGSLVLIELACHTMRAAVVPQRARCW